MLIEFQESRNLTTGRGSRRSRVGWLTALGLAVGLAAYAGFRLPSLYSMTLYNIGISDGAWRRGIFATLLTPLWEVSGYRYGVMALVALSVLAALVVSAFLAVWGAQWDTQRLLVIAWVISPAGAYMFHEVGYLDQVVYLLFLVAAVSLGRISLFVITLVMTFSVLMHEVTLLTTLPLIVFMALIRGLPLLQLSFFSIPFLAGVVLFFAPLMTEEQVGATGTRLQELLPFEIRWDAVALFGRSLSGTWDMEFYSPRQGFLIVLPLLLASLLAVGLLVWWLAPFLDFQGSKNRLLAVRLTAFAATGAPFLLVFLGWDFYRWAFLGLTNFLIVAFIWLGHCSSRPSVSVIAALLFPLALLFYAPLQYFDGYSSRPLTPEAFERIGYSPHTEFLGFPDDRL